MNHGPVPVDVNVCHALAMSGAVVWWYVPVMPTGNVGWCRELVVEKGTYVMVCSHAGRVCRRLRVHVIWTYPQADVVMGNACLTEELRG